VHWVALFGLFGLMAIALPKGKGKNSALLLLGLVSLAFLIIEGEGAINSMAKRLDRHFNHGDWSAPASEVRTVSDGTVVMHRGKQERFYVVGTVRLINNNDYTCLKISPEGRFAIVSRDDFRTNFITPKSGGKEMVFVEV